MTGCEIRDMWKSAKKNPDHPLKVLEEKEIQAKLYGEFSNAKLKVASPPVSSPGKAGATERMSELSNVVGSGSWKSEGSRVETPATKPLPASRDADHVAKQDPGAAQGLGPAKGASQQVHSKKRVGWIVLLIILIGVGFLAISFFHRNLRHRVTQQMWMETTPSLDVHDASTGIDAKKKVVQSEADLVMAEPVLPQAPAPSRADSEVEVKSGASEKPSTEGSEDQQRPISEKVYSIQVCVFNAQTDAEKLVDRLRELELPAHLETAPRPAGGNRYIVLLGKDPAYSQAQKRLASFRKLAVSKEFNDAYIREI